MFKQVYLFSRRNLFVITLIIFFFISIQNQRLVTIIMNLLVGGIVPGTGKVLTPNSMLIGLAIITGLIMGFVILNRPRPNSQPNTHGWSTAISHKPFKLKVGKLPYITASQKRAIKQLVVSSKKTTNAYFRILHLLLQTTSVMCIYLAHLIYTKSRYALQSIWHVAEPQLRQLDNWLEKQFHKCGRWLYFQLQQHDNALFVIDHVRQYRRLW